MRIRTVKPEFFLHEGLYDLEVESGFPVRVAFEGLWCVSDRDGIFEWRPRKLKTQVLPYDDVDFSRVLDALTTRGFVFKYTVGGVEYGWIPSFLEHQVINNREKASKLPPPDEATIQAHLTRASRVGDAYLTILKRAQAEGKGREGKGKDTPKPPQGDNVDSGKKENLYMYHEHLQRILNIFRKSKTEITPATRKLDDSEKRAWKKVKDIATAETLDLIEKFYAANKSERADETWKRKMAPTALMNQWNQQVDLATAFFSASTINAQPAEPDNWRETITKLELHPSDTEKYLRWGWSNLPKDIQKQINEHEHAK